MNKKHLGVVEADEWLLPVEKHLEARYLRYEREIAVIGDIYAYADGFIKMGFHYDNERQGWRFREWLPAAKEVFLMGDFNDWDRYSIPLYRTPNGIWEYFFDDRIFFGRIVDGSHYKMVVRGLNGEHERINAYATALTVDKDTFNFTPYIHISKPFNWKGDKQISPSPLLIYEAHVGMAQESGEVGTFAEFTTNVLPRIKKAGYTALQLMGIAEHPYYGSFGYHVSNFFAPSSRFGSEEDLKNLVLEAHKMGIAVVMDIVHSHFVKNYNEGLNDLDGSTYQYTVSDDRRYQKYWDSMNFDYSKSEVRSFLLSNLRYWMDEFHFDGFRFDGVTSILYRNHGYQKFLSRDDYFNDNVNEDAILYLTLANKLIHTINPQAITIAEDVSGTPTLCSPIGNGGVGFDYRLGMAVPDLWIEMLEEPCQKWDLSRLWYELNNRTALVKTVGYCESHDQAMVGDQTIAFRLMGVQMYSSMAKDSHSAVIDFGMALHKIIRLITISTAGEAFMCFMGNEFGHPDWIDFPREGNGFSYDKAHRQWSLVDNDLLRYSQLFAFDRAMIEMVKREKLLSKGFASYAAIDNDIRVISFTHDDLLFVFNFNVFNDIVKHKVYMSRVGSYKLIITTDDDVFGGKGKSQNKFLTTLPDKGEAFVTMPPLTANVYKFIK
ncbi:MAG: alpha-amylase family glycosyl hydrolase [Rikenellaceae bacterium]